MVPLAPVRLSITNGRPRSADILLSGPLMASWLLTTVKGWAGRGARLVRFSDQNRGSTMPRDMAHFHGRVKRAYEENGRTFLELECWVSNQKGEVTTPGSALVEIPRRGASA